MFTCPRPIKIVRLVVGFGLVAIVLAGIAGQVIRDRSAEMAILFYLPLLPTSLAAVVLDLARRGRALPRARFSLTLLGVVGGCWAAMPMIGSRTVGKYQLADTEVTMIQWNVMWGGGPFRSPKTWAAQRDLIRQQDPDLIILSELPTADWFELLLNELGPGSSVAGIEHDPGSHYWFRMCVCSRWPVRVEKRMPLPGGVAMSAVCEVRGRAVRVLVVDGRSNPFVSRLPFLRALAEICRAAAEEGRPFDVLAGDFNTPGRAIGFDELTTQGFSLASRSAAGWRGTFPSWLPLYDIDHVWLRSGLRLRSCTLFTGPWSDHRGQFVSVLLSSP